MAEVTRVKRGAEKPRMPAGGRRMVVSSPGSGFTLIELMAVVLVIMLVVVLGLGLAGYVQKTAAIATTKSQLASIEAALEAYKSDWGCYPGTTSIRISTDGSAEASNNWLMYRALGGLCSNCARNYLSFPATQVHGDLTKLYATVSLTNLFDVFGQPFNYYCSPRTTLTNGQKPGATIAVAGLGVRTFTNLCTAGGQVNTASYDLFSYGPDRVTFLGMNISWGVPYYQGREVSFTNSQSAFDDITNWK